MISSLMALVIGSSVVITNASIPPTPEAHPDKILVLSCGPKQERVLTNLKEIPKGCKVVKEYSEAKK